MCGWRCVCVLRLLPLLNNPNMVLRCSLATLKERLLPKLRLLRGDILKLALPALRPDRSPPTLGELPSLPRLTLLFLNFETSNSSLSRLDITFGPMVTLFNNFGFLLGLLSLFEFGFASDSVSDATPGPMPPVDPPPCCFAAAPFLGPLPLLLSSSVNN